MYLCGVRGCTDGRGIQTGKIRRGTLAVGVLGAARRVVKGQAGPLHRMPYPDPERRDSYLDNPLEVAPPAL